MMKKRIMAVITTSVLCMSISFGVFAGSTGRSGTTAGGSMGVLNTSATLSVDFDKAIAKTSSGSGAEVTYATSVIFYYMNSNGQKVTDSDSGSATATAGNATSKGRNATSQHCVNGGSNWGSWSCVLSASV